MKFFFNIRNFFFYSAIIFFSFIAFIITSCSNNGGDGDSDTNWDVRLEVPFVQNYGETCASSSMAMMLQYYYPEITFNEVYDRAGPPPYINYDAVDVWIREEFNLSLRLYDDRTIDDVINCIDDGYPVMVLQVKSMNERTGHNRVVIGYNLDDERFLLNDPSDFGPNYPMRFDVFDDCWTLWDQIGDWGIKHFLWVIIPIDEPDPI